MKIISVGDNVCDCYLYQKKYYPGGNCVNVAVNSKRLGAEESAYIGIFGTDDKADHIKNVLNKEKVDFSLSRTLCGLSGQPGVKLDENGDRVFVSSGIDTVQTLVKLRLTENDLNYIEKFDVCHTSCYSWLEEELPKLKERTKISFDFSNHFDIEEINKVAPYLSFAFLSASDLTDEEIEKVLNVFSSYNVEVVGLTRGSKEAIFQINNVIYKKMPIETKVVDTMGAGDSFIAGFLYSYLNGNKVEECLNVAAESAKNTCKFNGGIGYPHDII